MDGDGEDMAVVDDDLALDLTPAGAAHSVLPRDDCPDDLLFAVQPFGMDLHPSRDLLAVGLVNGVVSVFQYSVDGNQCVMDGLAAPTHQAAANCVRFDSTGALLFSCGTDRTLVITDVGTGVVAHRLVAAHDASICALSAFAPNMIATGDDDGVVKLWDTRTRTQVSSFSEHEDYVTDFCYHDAKNTLVSVAGGGSLQVFSTRKMSLIGESYAVDDDLLSAQFVKNGKTVVVGTQEGPLCMWSAGKWDEPSDRLTGHPSSVDAIVKVDEDTIVTGSSDGLLRLINVQPNRLLGVVGEHSDFPIEAIRISHDRRFLASASHDNRIKLWNIAYLFEEDDEEAPMDAGEEQEEPLGGGDSSDSSDSSDRGGRAAAIPKPSSKKSRKGAFYSGLE